MGARQKLNELSVLGGIAVAGVIGAMADSAIAFVVAAVVLIAAAIGSGDVRLRQPPRRGRSPRRR